MDALRKNGFFGVAALLVVAWIGLGAAGSKYALLPALLAAAAAAAGTVQRDTRWGLVATSALGLGCGGYLFQQKLALTAGPSICNIDQVFNCDLVNGSSYSVVAGVPVALAGAAFYAGLLVAGIFGPKDEAGDVRLARLAAVLGLPAVGYSLFLAWASVQLGATCIVCITMYLVNVTLFLGGLRALQARGLGLGADLADAAGGREGVALVVVATLVLLAGVKAYQDANPMTALVASSKGPVPAGGHRPELAMLYKAPGGPVTVDGDEPRIGPADARYAIVEYADFGCPHCRDAKSELEELVAARKDVSVTFKYFPLSGSCNPALPDDQGVGKARCDAALAAECAHRQGHFWEMATQLFTNQGYFEPEQLEFMAGKVGVDVAAWKACMADAATLERIKRSGQSGARAGVEGTPALFVPGLRDGEYVDVVRGPAAVLMLIEAHEDGQELGPGAARIP